MTASGDLTPACSPPSDSAETALTGVEPALRHSEERLRLLYENIKDYAMIMLDPRGQVVAWNAGAQEIKGYLEQEIIGQPMDRFYVAEEVAAGKPAALLKAARNAGSCKDEGWRIRKDGSLFYAEMILRALFDDSGQLIGYAKITRDITERKRVERDPHRQFYRERTRRLRCRRHTPRSDGEVAGAALCAGHS